MPALTPRSDSFRIPKRQRHVPEARAHVRRILKDWAIDGELAHDVATVATELVTNAVRHCRVTLAEVEVVVSVRGCGVLVEVSDPDKEKVPAPRGGDAEQDGGRGLVLVAALSERWGHEARPFTKCVWAYFVVPGREG
ncbi:MULTISPECIES: ATP-binding protein [Streptomyces]|uniref:ATP-binding protein n=1 Tax=Streptomyces caniscabiei TaxID=2746961 RepID=A0ABU4MJF2_9ACTN|nr:MULTISPECIES: ATP-binding protein [Streptomyces]MBE4735218.1 ATP-binding protein [Streptomyces caniscabiei]MBE4754352.1 ATP-binding protein [Streptomyces caniscabiei]MBE4767944.1 ATP-binding protein [Streptomyces caniscabiei]MBE4784400.1 ATP-binding protein [Streptomyces caniscabiei]MBE4791101.1 ATP-binding protein [Streptomyces caniscabiei]